MDTLKVIDQLEIMVEQARPKLLGFVHLDEDHFFQLTAKLRASLPEDVRRAGKLNESTEQVLHEAQTRAEEIVSTAQAQGHRIVDDAHQEAERMLDAARDEARRVSDTAQTHAGRTLTEAKEKQQTLTEQSEIARIATAQAREIIAQAEAEAEQIRLGADDYARETLVQLEEQVQAAARQVTNRFDQVLGTVQRGRQTLERSDNKNGAAPGQPQTARRNGARSYVSR